MLSHKEEQMSPAKTTVLWKDAKTGPDLNLQGKVISASQMGLSKSGKQKKVRKAKRTIAKPSMMHK
jgi:hypothetical protein